MNNSWDSTDREGSLIDVIDALKLDKSEFKDLSEKISNESKRAGKAT